MSIDETVASPTSCPVSGLGLLLAQPGRHRVHRGVHDKHRKFRMYGTWHLLDSPEGLQYEKYFREKTSIWDGTIADIGPKICEFLS